MNMADTQRECGLFKMSGCVSMAVCDCRWMGTLQGTYLAECDNECRGAGGWDATCPSHRIALSA